MYRSVRVMMMTCVFAFGSIASAQAGFQWTAPSSNSNSGTPRVAAAPVAPVTTETLPQNLATINDDPVTWNAPMNQAPLNQVPRQPEITTPAPVATAPLAPQTPMAQPVIAQTAPTAYNNSTYNVAQGFGNDLPLVMAIRQIVPVEYGFIFDDGIDMSTQVSWQGGRPWDVVLQDTLASKGLTSNISGKSVSILRANNAASTAQTANNAPTPLTLGSETIVSSNEQTMAATPISMTANPVVMGGYTNAVQASTAQDLSAVTTWTAPRNSTLRTILENWSSKSGVELYWSSEYDYPVQSTVSIQGTYEEAVQTLLKGLSESKPRPMGRLHPNLPNGPAVLIIETRQNSM